MGTRMREIDLAKGIGICSVLGHCFTESWPEMISLITFVITILMASLLTIVINRYFPEFGGKRRT